MLERSCCCCALKHAQKVCPVCGADIYKMIRYGEVQKTIIQR